MDKIISSIHYFNDGKSSEVSNFDQEQIMVRINAILKNAAQPISLIVTPEYIEEIKGETECIEITFYKSRTFTIGDSPSNGIKKILIPVSGKLVGDENSPTAIIFIANESGYITGPVGCTSCLEFIKDLKNLIN